MRTAIALAAFAISTAGCASAAVEPHPDGPASHDMDDRLTEISAAVTAWRSAETLEEAQEAAERALNLVVGRSGQFFGDGNGDGTIEGNEPTGLLPGLNGERAVATPINQCVERDILGGSWADPEERWRILAETIAAWTPTNNTFPTLPSHPMRIVGWATLTLATTTLDDAHEYAGHARLHVDISLRALNGCT